MPSLMSVLYSLTRSIDRDILGLNNRNMVGE